MKVKLILLACLVALPYTCKSQEDDMYFIPSRKRSVTTTEAIRTAPVPVEPVEVETDSCYMGKLRDIDEYNRRALPSDPKDMDVVLIDTLGMEWMLSKNDAGDYMWVPVEDYQKQQSKPNYNTGNDGMCCDEDDYCCTSRLARFHGCVTPFYIGWYDPWYYDYWWYDPWYSWYYHPWYWGYGWGLGWYGWSWGWNPGWHHGVGFAYGGRRGSTFGHIGGGALATAGRGRTMSSTYARNNNRTNTAERKSVNNSRNTLSSFRNSVNTSSRTTTSSRSVGSSSRGVTSGFSGGGISSGSRGGGFSGGGFSGGGARGGGGGGRR